MKTERFDVNGIPCVVYGNASDAAFIFVHGKCASKEAAESFARLADSSGFQTFAFDLPEHGERACEKGFVPWRVVPELLELRCFARSRWSRLALRADSIGAWFSMLAYADECFEKCLFVSPVLDMEALIMGMLSVQGLDETALEAAGEIPSSSGDTLSFRYLQYARSHAISSWKTPSSLLFAGYDPLTARSSAELFAKRFSAGLTFMENGEHFFHTPEQLDFLREWTKAQLL